MTEPLLVEREEAVATVTLQRPESLNSLNRPLVQALHGVLSELEADTATRVVILTGAGGNFCSGVDLGTVAADRITREGIQERIDEFHSVIYAIVESRKPFLARVDGAAVGFGADLALACDLRVLSSTAYLQEKFVDIGLMPDGGGTFFLSRLVGVGRALEYLMLGTRIEAERAHDLGLANRVVPAAELDRSTREYADELSTKAPLALAAIKQATRAALSGSLDAALRAEKRGQTLLALSEDFREGVRAFTERRKPIFRGQ
jgi:enoyl-CoA hydratase/carnithine racemase